MTHVESTRVYVGVFALLLVFTGVTIAISQVDLGPLNTVAALLIAGVKALLVVLYFMHLRHSSRLIWLVAGAGVFWLAILLVLTMSDVATRGWG